MAPRFPPFPPLFPGTSWACTRHCPPGSRGGGGAGTCFNFHSEGGGTPPPRTPSPPPPPAQASPWGGVLIPPPPSCSEALCSTPGGLQTAGMHVGSRGLAHLTVPHPQVTPFARAQLAAASQTQGRGLSGGSGTCVRRLWAREAAEQSCRDLSVRPQLHCGPYLPPLCRRARAQKVQFRRSGRVFPVPRPTFTKSRR